MEKRRGGTSRPTFHAEGTGETLVLVPGIQGRWEWMRPAVSALARHFRVVTFSLLGEPGYGRGATRFDSYLEQVDAVMEAAGSGRGVLCGVSFGGLVAVRYAADRPSMVSRLILVSTPSPRWVPDERVRRYANAPRSSTLSFVAGAPGRLLREVAAAVPEPGRRASVLAGYLRSIVVHPTLPTRMAARVRTLAGCDFVEAARRVTAPTLLITGEPSLDRVVPVEGTREYLELIRGAVGVTLERTGHLGCVTRPSLFADIVWNWARGTDEASGRQDDPLHSRP